MAEDVVAEEVVTEEVVAEEVVAEEVIAEEVIAEEVIAEEVVADRVMIAPVVSFLSPSEGAVYEEGASLDIEASSTDPDGTVAFIRLSVNGEFVRDERFAPYNWGSENNDLLLQSLPAGEHELTVVATDDEGLTATATVTITMLEAAPEVVPDSLADFRAGEKVYNEICAACHSELNESSKRGRSASRIEGALLSNRNHRSLRPLSDEEIRVLAYALNNDFPLDAGVLVPIEYTPLFSNSDFSEEESRNWRVLDDGTIVTIGTGRSRSRHESENSFYTFPTRYFEHRSFGFEIHDNIANGATQIAIFFDPEFSNYQKPECRSAYSNMWRADFNNNGTFSPMKVVEPNEDGEGERWVCYITRDAHDGDDGRLEVGEWMEVEFQQFLGRYRDDPEVVGQTVYYTDTYRFKIGEPGIYLVTDEALDAAIRSGGEATAAFVNAGGVVTPESVISATDTDLTYFNKAGEETVSPILDGTEVYENYVVDDEAALFTSFSREALNLRWDSHKDFLRGRRLFHSSFVSGIHIEDANPELDDIAGLATGLSINERCASCHVNNGRGPAPTDPASAATFGVKLSNGILSIYDKAQPHLYFGDLLQNRSDNENISAEGSLQIEYTPISGRYADGSTYELMEPNYTLNIVDPDAPDVPRFSPRMPQKVVGLGLLEAIADDDIAALRDPRDLDGDGISGRVSLVQDPERREVKIGRFGWKATQASLTSFAAGALNGDIGVKTSLFPFTDCGFNQQNCRDAETSSEPLEDENLNLIVAYLRGLGAPARRPDEILDEDVELGEEIFNAIGCGSCHVPAMKTGYNHPMAELRGQTIHAYTDLLLHDMGAGLADDLTESDEYNREWRTPPLWGLGLVEAVDGHTHLLHDGRARSVEEAILWHGGEALSRREAFVSLPAESRRQLLAFLHSL